MECLTFIIELINGLSVTIAAGIAIYGVNAWRREQQGRRQFEIAEEVLALFYEAADAIRMIRSPGGFSTEHGRLTREPHESDDAFRAREMANVVFVRYQTREALFARLHALSYRFSALVGRDESRPFEEIEQIVKAIFRSARMLARLWTNDVARTEEQFARHRASVNKHEAVFWEQDEEDDINRRLDAAVSQMESTCRRLIQGRAQQRRADDR